jgi:hypothetical protein
MQGMEVTRGGRAVAETAAAVRRFSRLGTTGARCPQPTPGAYTVPRVPHPETKAHPGLDFRPEGKVHCCRLRCHLRAKGQEKGCPALRY